jgi:hypothetical protein
MISLFLGSGVGLVLAHTVVGGTIHGLTSESTAFYYSQCYPKFPSRVPIIVVFYLYI